MKASGSYYKPELDVLRFGAFLLVFLHHVFSTVPVTDWENYAGSALAPKLMAASHACGLGLALFFFLSAYLITTLLLMELHTTGKIHIPSFYLRRILRIWPLYALGLMIALVYALIYPEIADSTMVVYFSVFLGNWYFQHHSWSNNPMAPLWSISVEEQFYLIWPLMMVALNRRHLLFAGIAALCLSAAGLWWQGNNHEEIGRVIWTNPMSQFIFFSSGILLALATFERTIRIPSFLRWGGIIVALFFFFIACYVFDAKHPAAAASGWSVLNGYLLAATGCALLVTALLDIQYRFPGWLIYLGKISFGLYVFHLVGMRIVSKILTMVFVAHQGHLTLLFYKCISLPLTVIMAMLSYRYLETPFLRLRKRFTFVANRPE